jgi:hypothetical protein
MLTLALALLLQAAPHHVVYTIHHDEASALRAAAAGHLTYSSRVTAEYMLAQPHCYSTWNCPAPDYYHIFRITVDTER